MSEAESSSRATDNTAYPHLTTAKGSSFGQLNDYADVRVSSPPGRWCAPLPVSTRSFGPSSPFCACTLVFPLLCIAAVLRVSPVFVCSLGSLASLSVFISYVLLRQSCSSHTVYNT